MKSSGFYMGYLERLIAKNPAASDICGDAYWNERRRNELEKTTNQVSTAALRRVVLRRFMLLGIGVVVFVAGAVLMR
jgi:hypothetical protein